MRRSRPALYLPCVLAHLSTIKTSRVTQASCFNFLQPSRERFCGFVQWHSVCGLRDLFVPYGPVRRSQRVGRRISGQEGGFAWCVADDNQSSIVMLAAASWTIYSNLRWTKVRVRTKMRPGKRQIAKSARCAVDRKQCIWQSFEGTALWRGYRNSLGAPTRITGTFG